jgi:hypothetical protein
MNIKMSSTNVDMRRAREFARKHGYDPAKLKTSPIKGKKLRYDDGVNKVDFGGAGNNDYTIYLRDDGVEKARVKRAAYDARSSKIKTDGKYSANALARAVLWDLKPIPR